MLLANLSSQERQLYSLIGLGLSAALVLGLLGGLISFGGSGNERADNWQETSVPNAIDTLTEFTAISTEPRWFNENPILSAEQSAEAARKAVEGQPESLKLIGIVERNGKSYALFIPASSGTSTSASPKGVLQFAAGDTLVGDWLVKSISASTVTVETRKEAAEQQTREISLYQTKK